MPIIDLQRRMRQLGEIRIGRVVDTGKVSQRTGRPILRPEKLDRFRLTSASRPILEQVAALYGGEVQPWTPANGGPAEWEVYTDADRLPVVVPPRDPVTLWYEQYKGSKCVRRCDGEIEQKSDQPCMCNPDKRDCQITMRLNVMLRDVPGLGVWLLTSHGFFAATELPEVAEFLSRAGGYVDAWLAMEEKQLPIVDANGKAGTARFMVPKLDVDLTPAQLLAGQGARAELGQVQRAAVGQEQRAAIEAPQGPAPTAEDFLTKARAATTWDEFKVIWKEAGQARVSPTPAQEAEMTAIGKRLKAAVQQPAPESSTGTAKGDEAQSAPAATDAEMLWQAIVARWPRGMTELAKTFQGGMGVQHQAASESELAAFLKILSNGKYDDPASAAPAGAEDKVPF